MTSTLRSLASFIILGTVSCAAVADTTFPTTPGAAIEISSSAGKFDFLRIDEKHQRLLASHEEDGFIDIIDLKTAQVVKRIKVGSAVDTAMDPESRTYYVSVQEAQRVAVINAKTLVETGSIKVPGPTDAIIFDPTNRLVYVTFDGGNAVWVIDPNAEKLVATIPVAGVPEFMVYDAKTNRIYLNLKTKSVVTVIDPTTNKVVTEWATAPATAPHGLALDEANHQILSAGGNGKLVAIDTGTGAVSASIDIVAKVDQIAFSAAAGLVYCAGPGKISVVAVSAGKLADTGSIATFPSARNVAVEAATGTVWTTYTDGKNSFARSWKPAKQ